VRRSPPGVLRDRELWSFDLRSGTRRLLFRIPDGGEVGSAGFTPDSRYALFWPDLTGSASIAADGLPLAAVPLTGGKPRTLIPVMLAYPDFIAQCTNSLVVAAGAGRETNLGKSLAELSPPSFRAASLELPKTQSWTTPSCSTHGSIAAATGPSREEPHFGLEHRSIWLIRAPGQRPLRLTSPGPRQVSDELPRLSPGGRYILFIRGHSDSNGVERGALELLALSPSGRAHLIGPIAQLGSAGIGYYGHYGWSDLTASHQR
jgi:hypothetical protein